MAGARRLMADFLLELLSEEIPARMQAKARNELARLFAECTERGGARDRRDRRSFDAAAAGADRARRRRAHRGEPRGNQGSAHLGAAAGARRVPAQDRPYARTSSRSATASISRSSSGPGRAAAEILGETVEAHRRRFPLAQVDALGLGIAALGAAAARHRRDARRGDRAGRNRRHRLAARRRSATASTIPAPITIGGAADYVEKLRACHVIVDQEERERIIREGAEAAAAKAGLSLLPDEGLVVENAGLTEWPVPLLGEFDEDFLDVPREVIVLTMRTNQKYFACTASDGGLGAGVRVRREHRRERRRRGDRRGQPPGARRAPRRRPLLLGAGPQGPARGAGEEARRDRLPREARHRRRQGRARRQARALAGGERRRQGATPNQVERAARLAKADLVTGMVGEFPELQGVIGGYLAEAQGEPKAVADAIRDHYKPVGQGDEVPTGAGQRRGRAGGQAGLRSCGFFAVGLEADRIEGPVRASARGDRVDRAHHPTTACGCR